MAASVEISDLRILPSPRADEVIRISVEVRYGRLLMRPERAWFEIPDGKASEANSWGDSWLVTYLPLAVTLGQPLRLMDLPVDPQLLVNAQKLMAIWSEWHPELSPVPIEADQRSIKPTASSTEQRGSAAFFSGGIDSFFTTIHNLEVGIEALDDLLFLHGVDIAIDNDAAFRRCLSQYSTVAEELGLCLLPVATNVRKTMFYLASWTDLSFVCLLAGAALQLSEHYSTVLIASGHATDQIVPHSSHPQTDPLLSNSRTAFVHYGGDWDRHEKIQFLLSHPLALNNLRVCYESESGENCGRCRKCLITMATLEIFGRLADSEAFAATDLDLDRLRRAYFGEVGFLYRGTLHLARERRRQDIAEAITAAFRWTDRLNTMMLFRLVLRLRRRLMFRPTGRRLLRPLYHPLRRAAIWLNRHLP